MLPLGNPLDSVLELRGFRFALMDESFLVPSQPP